MADGKIRVKFEAEGAPELIAAIKALNTQTKRLGTEQQRTSTTTAKLNTQQERQVRNQNLLNVILGKGAINLAMIRAKMLLYAFAVRQATVFIGGFMKEAAAFDGVERSFKQLAFSTDLNTDSLKKFSNATKNTVSNLDIMKQANNAMLLGIADSTDQLAEMFTISHKLAKAVGKDATFGMESLTTGIGRQSRLMLDNLGIIVIAEKAYKKYADTLKKKSSDLTDSEKKQAFLNEAMSQATEMASLLPAPIEDASDKYNQLATSLENAKVVVGDINFLVNELDEWKNEVTSDTNWHTLKIELTAGATHFTIDGVLRDSSKGSENETDAKVQPQFYSSTAGSSQGGNIRYLEAYNT